MRLGIYCTCVCRVHYSENKLVDRWALFNAADEAMCVCCHIADENVLSYNFFLSKYHLYKCTRKHTLRATTKCISAYVYVCICVCKWTNERTVIWSFWRWWGGVVVVSVVFCMCLFTLPTMMSYLQTKLCFYMHWLWL